MHSLRMLRLACLVWLGASLSHAAKGGGKGKQHVVEVRQSTFDAGALIVSRRNTVLRFMEDVQFGAGWGADNIPASPFPLGWFAGIVVQVNNVEIDLNGHEFSMDPTFYLQQRFFALIELGSKPFIEGQGPADWGNFTSVRDVEVHHGKLGLSSHHGIHGSDVVKVSLHHLDIYNFEVAAIHLNGAHKTSIEDCDLGPSKTDVPVLATFSNALFLLPEVEAAASADPAFEVTLGAHTRTLQTIADNLRTAVASPLNHPLFHNPHGRPDGSAVYGLVIHRIGVAVGLLGEGEDLDGKSSVEIERVHVHDLDLQATVWASLNRGTGPFGDRLNFELALDEHDHYQGNVLFDAQVALMLFAEAHPDFGGPWTLTSEVGPLIQAWSVSAERLQDQSWWEVNCDRDVMHHGIKGAFGMRLEFADAIDVRKSTVTNVQGRVDTTLSSRFCTDSELLVVGMSVGKHDNVHISKVEMQNVGTAGFFTFDNGQPKGRCKIKKSVVCGAGVALQAGEEDDACASENVVTCDHV